MAPECFTDKKYKEIHQTNAVDVWSLGVIMYELITKKEPFVHEDTGALIH